MAGQTAVLSRHDQEYEVEEREFEVPGDGSERRKEPFTRLHMS